jgi:O-succinylbenzoate synthase
VKIKITPHRQALSELCDVLNKKSIEGELPLLRFDGNRQFEIADLLYFLNNLNDSVVNKIEYIEEPFKIFYDLYIFQKIFKLKIAIDESLIYFQENLDLLPPQTPIVLKPALYGISKSFELISKAQQLGHFIIVSSTYQPSSQFFPLLWLAHYADSFSKTPHFHGLDTLNFLPDPYINSQVLNSLSIY